MMVGPGSSMREAWGVSYVGDDMDKLDRLLERAAGSKYLRQLGQDNPYVGKGSDELLDYLSGDDYRAPEMGTQGWDQFMYALIHAPSVGGLTE